MCRTIMENNLQVTIFLITLINTFKFNQIVSQNRRTDDGTVFSRIFEEGLPKLSNPMFIMLFGLTNYSKQFFA